MVGWVDLSAGWIGFAPTEEHAPPSGQPRRRDSPCRPRDRFCFDAEGVALASFRPAPLVSYSRPRFRQGHAVHRLWCERRLRRRRAGVGAPGLADGLAPRGRLRAFSRSAAGPASRHRGEAFLVVAVRHRLDARFALRGRALVGSRHGRPWTVRRPDLGTGTAAVAAALPPRGCETRTVPASSARDD